MGKTNWIWGIGRRKTSVARVRLATGTGQVQVNDKPVDGYFAKEKDRSEALLPLTATKSREKYDIFVNVQGGGTSGQAGAVKLGIARALFNADPDNVKSTLREFRMMTRDPREKERKKYGHKKARKSFQWTKR